jgi:dienelactone hydrolase
MRRRFSILFVLTLAVTALAQAPAQKKFVTPEDAKNWETLSGARISNDGRWFAYGVNVVDGDGRLVVRSCDGPSLWTTPYGSNAVFSEDSNWVAYTIGLPKAEVEKLREQKKSPEMKLGLRKLASGEEQVLDSVQSWRFLKTGKHLLAHRYRGEGKTKGGSDLVLFDLETGARLSLGNVSSYLPNEAGTSVALRIESDNGERGVQILDPETMALRPVHWSKGNYPALTWAKEKDAIAFLVGTPDEKKEGERHQIVLATGLDAKTPTLQVFDPAKFAEFPKDFRIVEFGPLELNDDATSVGFGIQDWTDKKKPGKPDQESTVQVWHYKDIEVMPFQVRQAERKKRENRLCVWRTEKNLFYPIGTDRWLGGQLLDNHRYALIVDGKAHETPVVVGGILYSDWYLVEIDTARKDKVLERARFGVLPSPKGRHLAYYHQKSWWTYDCATGARTKLGGNVKADWSDVDDDHVPAEKPPADPPYWLEDDKALVIYTKFDAYLARPGLEAVERLTKGAEEGVICRLQDPIQDEFRVRLGEPMLFSMFQEKEKNAGFLLREPSGETKVLVMDQALFGPMIQAKDADRVFVTMQTFEQPPTVLLSNRLFTQAKPMTALNPQQKDYHWGKAELVHFKNKAGKELQGILMYPAGYEAGKSYPMITYIYEKLSNGLHAYRTPNDAGSYNPQLFLQSGYFVFMPDIVYRDRNPGLSALDCVTAGVNAVLKKNVGVDPKKLGLMGHSWGGYQTAFIVTQTNMFAAANAGAPLTELRSMYNSFYWNVGITDQVIFEASQGRMGVPWWEDPASYRANNPLDHAEKIQTPLLVEFGDQDGAVDFHQGQQLYNTLRRMGKPIVMLVYVGENHNNSRRPNQVDYAARQRHFFDVYLKGAKPEPWLREGLAFGRKEG